MASTSGAASTLQLVPEEYHKSYLKFSSYPCNVILNNDYPDVLEGLRQNLDNVADDLLTDPSKHSHHPKKQNEPKIRVTFRDWDSIDKSE